MYLLNKLGYFTVVPHFYSGWLYPHLVLKLFPLLPIFFFNKIIFRFIDSDLGLIFFFFFWQKDYIHGLWCVFLWCCFQRNILLGCFILAMLRLISELRSYYPNPWIIKLSISLSPIVLSSKYYYLNPLYHWACQRVIFKFHSSYFSYDFSRNKPFF